MPEPTKKRRIDVKAPWTGPEGREAVDWRELLSGEDDGALHGRFLKGARTKEGLTQKELSRLTGIPQGHISEIENGKRPIGKIIARKLGEALNIDYRVFL